MSKALIGVRQYHCSSDCMQTGCPGHELKVEMDCSTDTYIVHVDGNQTELFDENYLHALIGCIGVSQTGNPS